MFFQHLGIIFLPLISIDIFYFFYILVAKLLLKRYQLQEQQLEKKGYSIKKTTIDDVKNKGIFISYIIGTIFGILSYYIIPSFYNECTFFIDILKIEFSIIGTVFLIIASIIIIIARIKGFVLFSKNTFKYINSNIKENKINKINKRNK